MSYKNFFPIIFFSLFIAGCTHTAGDLSAVVLIPEKFSQSSGALQTPDRWWIVFDDPELEVLVEEALQSNLTLRAAYSRLRAAQALFDRESSGLYPDFDGSLDATKSRSVTTDTKKLELGLMSDYEVDLWGRIRAGIESDEFQARATAQIIPLPQSRFLLRFH